MTQVYSRRFLAGSALLIGDLREEKSRLATKSQDQRDFRRGTRQVAERPAEPFTWM
jgi:hypothetical protein